MEAIPESIKNMLLVMSTSGVFEGRDRMWEVTWGRLDAWLPRLKEEIFPNVLDIPVAAAVTETMAAATTAAAMATATAATPVDVSGK